MPTDLAVALTGASGAPYGLALVRALALAGRRVHVVVSAGGARVLREECDLSLNPKAPDPRLLAPEHAAQVVPHSVEDYGASIASGSFPLGGMAVCPCSMGTLARIAAGTAENLVTRAADVCLKERRPLVLVPREAPLSAIHLGNMLRLAAVDPETAKGVHPNDRRRITRALEVFEVTGKPLREQQTQFEGPDRHDAVIAGIRLPRKVLAERIRVRVSAMFHAGLVDEVRGLDLGPTASQAVGYKELLGALRGEYDLAEARRLVERNTLRLARRQETWFKRFPVRWVDGAATDLVDRLLAVFRGGAAPRIG
jgi:4-hydroxy-3-polyprenylbenzoate decarboxylase